MSCCIDAWSDPSWQALPIAVELAAAPSAVGVVHTLTIQTQRAMLLGRLQLSYDETAGLVSIDQDGLQVSNVNLNQSRQTTPGALFLPDSPGLVGANYIGMPLLPSQTLTIRGTSTGALSVSALVYGRPLSRAEVEEAEALRSIPPQSRLLFGLGQVTIAAGGTGVLEGVADRAIDELGYLVLDQDPTNNPADLRVTGLTVQGQPIDAEVTPAAYFAAHRAHTASMGRAVPLGGRLPVGGRVQVTLQNTGAAPLTIGGGFIRAPRTRQVDGSAAAPLRPDAPGFSGGIAWGEGPPGGMVTDDVSDLQAEEVVRAWQGGRLPARQAAAIGSLVKAVGARPQGERERAFKDGLRALRKQGGLTFLGGR